jgi:formylglycine-generating enzyme required for sulfatase activity
VKMTVVPMVKVILLSAILAFALGMLSAKPVGEFEAKLAARNWMKLVLPQLPDQTEIQMELIEFNGQNYIYILNFPDMGFVILSADDCCQPVLAWSESGSFCPNPGSPAVADWLNGCEAAIAEAITQRRSEPSNRAKWDALISGSLPLNQDQRQIPQLLNTTWHQSYPYNTQCPPDPASPAGGYAWAGCGAAAMAQVMRYWGYPEQGSGSVSYANPPYGTVSANFGQTSYNWDDMPSICPPGNTAIPELMFHCGLSLHTNYAPDVSTFYVSYMPSAFNQYFGYSQPLYTTRASHSDAQWQSILTNELNAGRPLIYISTRSGAGVSHLYILDGYQQTGYYHINWCWGGEYDGYYYLDELTPGGMDYNSNQQAIYNIYPLENIPQPPLSLSAQPFSTYAIDLEWIDNSANESGFEIERSINAENWMPVVTLPANTTSWRDLTLQSHTTYYYRIRSLNTAGNSGWSNVAWASTTIVIGVVEPGLTLLGPDSLLLEWNALPGAISYRIYSANDPSQEQWNLLGETPSLNFNAGTNSSRQFFRITALTSLEMPPDFVLVEGGTFFTGTSDAAVSEFFISQTEVTQLSWQNVMGDGYSGDPDNPRVGITWFKAIEYCNRRSLGEGLAPCYSYLDHGTNPDEWPAGWDSTPSNHTGISCDFAATGYRLPTEMEWMFASLGGNDSQGYAYSGSNDVDQVAWYYLNASNTAHPVGEKQANELYLYDMSGNAFEWVWDIYGDIPSTPSSDYHGPIAGSNRVRRGGAYNSNAPYCENDYRGSYSPAGSFSMGFRLVRKLPRESRGR